MMLWVKDLPRNCFSRIGKSVSYDIFIPFVCFNKCYNTGGWHSLSVLLRMEMSAISPIFSSCKSHSSLQSKFRVRILCITCFAVCKGNQPDNWMFFALCAGLWVLSGNDVSFHFSRCFKESGHGSSSFLLLSFPMHTINISSWDFRAIIL